MSHIIVGPLGGGVQPRLEINSFITNEMFFSLYVQALNQMQGLNQNFLTSFYQVGGIHGFPFIEYDGASVPGFNASSGQWLGYCTHSCVLFPTWHRPYVMLIEQIINANAQQIAAGYTTADKADWQEAAVNLRQPYWDWATNIVPPNRVIVDEQVEITVSNGQKMNVTNPLRRYSFNPNNLQGQYANWPTTLRYPTSTSETARDDVPALIGTLSNSQGSITGGVFAMLFQVTNWPDFSRDTFGGGSANSLESIHDSIHVLVGSENFPSGHMSDPTVAGFDPIFFLHHANVDRLLSLWSALNPGVWVTTGDAGAGTWTLNPGQTVDGTTDLTPFWKTQTTFWNSNELMNTQQLGYTYPENADQDLLDIETFKTKIAGTVRRLYGPKSALVSSGKYSEWAARVQFKPSDVGHTFSVVFFMGNVPTDPKQWLRAKNFVGAHHAFIRSTQCTECDKDDSVQEGFVSLNPYILEHTNLTSLNSSSVAPLLTQQLQWRILGTDGQGSDGIPSLNITILETPVDFTGSDLPVVGNFKSWDNITRGRSGGASGKFSA